MFVKKLTFTLIFALALFGGAAAPVQALISSCAEPRSANAQDNYPVNHADINLEVRNWQSGPNGIHDRIGSVHGAGALDPAAPQLNTLLENNTNPGIGSLNAICNWAWDNGTGPGGHRENSTVSINEKPADYASLVGIASGGKVLVPQSGYDIGDGRQVIVLYATKTSITIKYGTEDSIVSEGGHGYAIHIEGITVAQDVLTAYDELNSAGRKELPALCAGHVLGTAGGEFLVSLRDSGSFLDPRWREDWWSGGKTGVANNSCAIKPLEVTKGPTTRTPRLETLIGRDAYDRLLIRKNNPAAEAAFKKQNISRYTKSAYCPAMGSNNSQDYVKSLSEEQFKTCSEDISRTGVVTNLGFASCPDYSPNRPYPGDTCFDFADIKKNNKAVFNMPDVEIETKIKYQLCDSHSGSCVSQTHNLGAIETVDVNFGANSFVEYLGTGNEYTANPNSIMSLKNDIARQSQYLTDYLRGFAGAPGVADRSKEMYDFLKAVYEYRVAVGQSTNQNLIAREQKILKEKLDKIPFLKEKLQLTSGVTQKIFTQAFKENNYDSNKVLLDRWLGANLPHDKTSPHSGDRPQDNVEKTPIGDYVVAYLCDGVPVMPEEAFPDSLERRKGLIMKNGKSVGDCSGVDVVRISDFICGNPNGLGAAGKGMDMGTVCRGKNFAGGASEEIYQVLWPYFFSLTTREDTPVRLRRVCEANSEPTDKTKIPSRPTELTGEEEENMMRADNIDSYYVEVEKDKKYHIVNRTFAYVGHLAEARELAYMTQKALLPASFNEKVADWTKYSPERAGNTEPSGTSAVTGDLIANDSILRVDASRNQMQYGVTKQVVLPNPIVWKKGQTPPTHTETVNAKCTISVEMPFIEEVATRTIGKETGFMRLFLPEKVGEELDKQAEAENGGASYASANYAVVAQEALPAGAGNAVEVNTTVKKAGQLPVPFVKKMALFQKVALGYGLNPASVQTGSSVILPGTGTTIKANAEWQKCMVGNVDFKNTSVRPADDAFDRMKSRYPNSWLGTQGRKMWDELISIASSNGFNPVLALAYWAEETHFTNPADNGNPQKAVGCGASASGTCIKSYSGQPEQELRDEFQCLVAKNTSGSCNVSTQCLGQSDTSGFIGCYQYGAGNPPSDDHLGNVMTFYYQMLGQSAPDCAQYK